MSTCVAVGSVGSRSAGRARRNVAGWARARVDHAAKNDEKLGGGRTAGHDVTVSAREKPKSSAGVSSSVFGSSVS
ncbi:MAG: hypothetical protein AAF108_00330 [Planctomycetota bacterium]